MTIRLLAGDCRDVLATLPDASVHCVVTSPPYYGLRDYGTAQWDGGDNDCDHKHPLRMRSHSTTLDQGADYSAMAFGNYRDTCGKCGARRIDRQLGLEATPDEYIATMVQVFREIRRVMRDDAVAFVNMGDGFRDKQLLMMPARLALALQADGWWLRSDIIWAKPNPMPESVTDRPTSAHEHVYLLTKKPRYYYDADAVREEATYGENRATYIGGTERLRAANVVSGGLIAGDRGMDRSAATSRNLRNVWAIATAPFPAAHFATFPPELAERCIRAGTSERGCCAACGKPWMRQSEISYRPLHRPDRQIPATRGKPGNGAYLVSGAGNKAGGWDDYPVLDKQSTTTGWSPGCQCEAGVVPAVVLDPFSGAGTSCLVADRLGRDAIGIDLSHAYVEMARERLQADCPLFADISPPPAEDPEDERMADLFSWAAD